MIREVDDLTLLRPVDRAVRRNDKTLQRLGMPVITAGLPLVAIHALLHDRPLRVGGDEEAVHVKIKTVLDRGTVDLRHQAAGPREHCAIEADAVAELQQLIWRLARMLAPAAADIDAELVLERTKSALQRADHGSGDAGGVPVHPHHSAERLEPERMGQPLEERIATVMMHDRLRDDRAQRGHGAGKPRWNPSGVERKIGAAGTSSHESLILAQFGDSCCNGMLRCTRAGSEAGWKALSGLTRMQ